MDSSLVCWKLEILFRRALVLPIGKKFERNAVEHLSQMSVGILIRLATERASLRHNDEVGLQVEIHVSHGSELAESLVSHSLEVTRGLTLRKKDSGFSLKFSNKLKPVMHYPVFTTKVKTTKVSLQRKMIIQSMVVVHAPNGKQEEHAECHEERRPSSSSGCRSHGGGEEVRLALLGIHVIQAPLSPLFEHSEILQVDPSCGPHQAGCEDSGSGELSLRCVCSKFVTFQILPSKEFLSIVRIIFNCCNTHDIWQHIHSRMPMRDAARAACVSHRFLRFWRGYPTVTIDQETLGLSSQRFWITSEDERGEYILTKAQKVLESRLSGSTIVQSLKLDLSTFRKAIVSATVAGGLLDCWLRAFVKPGIVDITVLLPKCEDDDDCYYYYGHDCLPEYTFPCSLLSDDEDKITSLQSLSLSSCGFHPTEGMTTLLGCWKSMSTVCLHRVAITDEELGFFLAGCLVLERLDLSFCNSIGALKIPSALRRLRSLRVRSCRMLRTIESGAPMLATVWYDGWPLLRFWLGGALETTHLEVHATRMGDVIQYAGSKLPSAALNLETLVLSTVYEIAYGIRWYNDQNRGNPDDGASCRGREASKLRNGGIVGNLRKVTITGFCSANSLVELTCHILVIAALSLEHLTLDTSPGYDRKCSSYDRCRKMSTEALREAETALAAARKYVEPKVPDSVNLMVLGPCGRCHLGMEYGS
uniref:Expressed protein n=1 Tax=Oryza sativa subsp. japonica TaxID=39947 RepID=Q7XF65_ORYSJ|nr:expressed protein [Oryza sativa Japonica Group]